MTLRTKQVFTDGSSPLARGTRVNAARALGQARFIPARAGNTVINPAKCAIPSVHPRSRGEHTDTLMSDAMRCGSSPLARGTPPHSPIGCGGFSVHPRSRGEHLAVELQSYINDGSSPLARGTLGQQAVADVEVRFIPARAGNTHLSLATWITASVHPRSRGEHRPISPPLQVHGGSSPLARGTRQERGRLANASRFIPARAGNTTTDRIKFTACHGSSPLARGTHHRLIGRGDCGRFIPARAGNTPVQVIEARLRHGSSPLARGTHRRLPAAARRARFIPARAGNTSAPTGCRSARSVHPRSRGEHGIGDYRPRFGRGSSPLARGTRCAGRRHLCGRRFIPARAGNTSMASSRQTRRTVHPRSRGEHAAIDAARKEG